MAAFNPIGFGILVLLGGVFAYQLKGSLSDARALVAGVDPASASPGDVVVATDTAWLHSELVQAPVSGTHCLGYIVVVEQRYRSRILVQWHADYLVGELPRFQVGDTHPVFVDLGDTLGGDGPAATLRNIAPPDDRFSPLDLELDERTATTDPGDPLPATVPGFEASRDQSYPVRMREHRIDEGDDLLLVGRAIESANGALTVDSDGLVVLSNRGRGHVRRRLGASVLIWLVATLLFLVPAALHAYTSLLG